MEPPKVDPKDAKDPKDPKVVSAEPAKDGTSTAKDADKVIKEPGKDA